MKKNIYPNTFLIGVQKAATTSLYHSLSKHPDICAPLAVKDFGFFTKDEFYVEKGLEYLASFYDGFYNDEKIILQGSAHYIFFEGAIKRIKEFNPDAKFILILRNPIERAVSSYRFAVKHHMETLDFEDALKEEEIRLQSNNKSVLSELTYKEHGLYFKQISNFLKYFKKDQIKIIIYDDLIERPIVEIKNVFDFLNIDLDYDPELKPLNRTGVLRVKYLEWLIFSKESWFRKLLLKSFKNIITNEEKRYKIRRFLKETNTKPIKNNSLDDISDKSKKELIEFYKKDIEKLSDFLNKDLSHWM